MAIDDIISRITADASAEADALTAAAKADAAGLVDEARKRSELRSASDMARALAEAERDASTLVANTRLSQRDAMLAARQELDREALDRAVEALVSLDDARYAAMLARRISDACGECVTMRFGSADEERLRRGLPPLLAAAGVSLEIDPLPADMERGVLLLGDRVRIEVSAAAMVASQRDELLAMADAELFGRGD